MAQCTDFHDLRSAAPPLLDAVLALNARHKVETSELDGAALRAMLAEAALAPALPDGSAFLIAFDETADYNSPNFLWFRERVPRFLYVDRVVVSSDLRGQGIARRFYDAVGATAQATRRDRIVCEVNFRPPNPTSDAFHAAMGFAEAGRAELDGGKVVRYLEKRLATGEMA